MFIIEYRSTHLPWSFRCMGIGLWIIIQGIRVIQFFLRNYYINAWVYIYIYVRIHFNDPFLKIADWPSFVLSPALEALALADSHHIHIPAEVDIHKPQWKHGIPMFQLCFSRSFWVHVFWLYKWLCFIQWSHVFFEKMSICVLSVEVIKRTSKSRSKQELIRSEQLHSSQVEVVDNSLGMTDTANIWRRQTSALGQSPYPG